MNKKIVIFDTTPRDGEQCPGASMSLKEKLEVARQSARLKVDVIEAGFPVISEGDFASVKAIATEIEGPIICALARCVKKDIVSAAQALKPAGNRGRIHVFVGTSPTHRDNLKKSRGEVMHMAVEGVKLAKSYVEDVEFSAMDATRTEPEFLVKIVEAAIRAGATTVNVPDTVGYAMPHDIDLMISNILRHVPEFKSGKVILSVHCHNDLGLAVANSLQAIRSGARQVECTINGIGERAGNAALEEVVMAIKMRPEYFPGVEIGVDTMEIMKTSKLVERMSGLQVQRSKAIVGENAFAHASGIHQDGMLKNRAAFEIINPADVGWHTDLPLTKHSGRAAVKAKLAELGFELQEEDVDKLFVKFKEIGDKKKFVYDDDLLALTGKHLTADPEVWRLEYVHAQGGNVLTIPTATVRLKNCTRTIEEAATGDGPFDAVFKAIDRVTKHSGKLLNFSLRAVSPGKDAMGEAQVEVEFDGKLFKGRSADTDSVQAVAGAYLNAANRFLQAKKAVAKK